MIARALTKCDRLFKPWHEATNPTHLVVMGFNPFAHLEHIVNLSSFIKNKKLHFTPPIYNARNCQKVSQTFYYETHFSTVKCDIFPSRAHF